MVRIVLFNMYIKVRIVLSNIMLWFKLHYFVIGTINLSMLFGNNELKKNKQIETKS